MKKFGMILCAVAAMGSNAFSQTSDDLLIWAAGAGSTPDSVPLTTLSNGDLGLAAPVQETFTINNQLLTLNLTSVDIASDPHIQIAFGVSNPTNATGMSSYSFTFASAPGAINLAPGQYTVHSSIGETLTTGGDDLNSTPVVLSTPTTGGAIMQSFVGSSTDVGGQNNAGVDLLGSPDSTGLTDTPISFTPSDPAINSNTHTFATIVSPTLSYNLNSTATQISVTTAFQLSNNDSASFTGRFDINPSTASTVTPEPSTNALLMAGLGILLLAVRRRWRAL